MVRCNRPMRAPSRGGFTLIELTVVLGIILLLVSLSVSAIMKVVSLQQRRNTEQLVLKLDKAFMQHWKAVIDQAKTDQVNPIANALSNNDPRRARVIHILMCLRREFPANFQEATQQVNYPGLQPFAPNPAYVRALQNYNQGNNWLGRTAVDQSSACLYLALKQRRSGVTFDPDTALAAGQELVDPNNDGVKEIIDNFPSTTNAQFQPIVFNRWPAANGFGSPVLNPNGPWQFKPAGLPFPFPPDTEDPEGLLVNQSAWLSNMTAAQQSQFLNTFLTTVQYPLGGQGLQYRLTPVIMSVGKDGIPDSGDDIYNFQLSALGGTNN